MDRQQRLQDVLGAGIEPFDERGIADVVAEGRKPELACRELDVRRPQEAGRCIDDANGFERGGVGQKRVPDAERPQQFDRAFKQCRGSRVESSRSLDRGRPDQSDLPADMRDLAIEMGRLCCLVLVRA